MNPNQQPYAQQRVAAAPPTGSEVRYGPGPAGMMPGYPQRYGPGPAGMMPTYPQQAPKASPRGRGQAPTAAMPKGAPMAIAQGMPTAGYPPGAVKAAAPSGTAPKVSSAAKSEGPVDFEFLVRLIRLLSMNRTAHLFVYYL